MYLGPAIMRVVYVAARDHNMVADIGNLNVIRISFASIANFLVSNFVGADNLYNEVAVLFGQILF